MVRVQMFEISEVAKPRRNSAIELIEVEIPARGRNQLKMDIVKRNSIGGRTTRRAK